MSFPDLSEADQELMDSIARTTKSVQLTDSRIKSLEKELENYKDAFVELSGRKKSLRAQVEKRGLEKHYRRMLYIKGLMKGL